MPLPAHVRAVVLPGLSVTTSVSLHVSVKDKFDVFVVTGAPQRVVCVIGTGRDEAQRKRGGVERERERQPGLFSPPHVIKVRICCYVV